MADPEKEGLPSVSSTASTMVPSPAHTDKEDNVLSDNDADADDCSTTATSSRPSRETIHSNPLEPTLSNPNTSTPADLTRLRTTASIVTTASRLPDFEVDFTPDDPANPKNWSLWYKSLTVFAMSFATWNTVFYSTSYTASTPGMMAEWHVSSEPLATLGITTYLLGLAVGSLILAPVSEIYGRRPVYVVCLLLFSLLILPCALATSLPEVIIVRFFGALAGSCMIANAPGTLSDISSDATRALVFSIWSIGPMNGPVTGPLIGGFAYQYLGWRWTNWLVLIFSGAVWLITSSISESYAPAILKRKAREMRAKTGDDRYWCRYDVKTAFFEELRINLTRPFSMALTEPILWFWNLYISVIYSIMYLCFVAYPFIYSGIRGWSPGISGLAFVGIGTGTMISIVSEPLIRRMINAHRKDPETGEVPLEATMSIICVAAFLVPIGQLVFSWTSTPVSIHWIWSILAGVPFGFGNTLIYIYSSSYIAGSYGIYAASALAGNTVIRSFFGGTLPLAGVAMYTAMTPRWAGTFLGLLEVTMIPIPIIFYKYGGKIRAKSPLIKKMREEQDRLERKQAMRGARAGGRGVGPDATVEEHAEKGEEKV